MELSMNSILQETIISLSAVSHSMPQLRAGCSVHPSTVWRWSRYGVNTPHGKIKLEVASLAGRKVTSKEALQRFLARVNEAKSGATTVVSPVLTATATPSMHANAKTELDKLGV
jgi:hypothetical protein